jgi:hypothetical protein
VGLYLVGRYIKNYFPCMSAGIVYLVGIISGGIISAGIMPGGTVYLVRHPRVALVRLTRPRALSRLFLLKEASLV